MAAKLTYHGGQIIYVIYKNILWCEHLPYLHNIIMQNQPNPPNPKPQ